jgi:hypothetical protein
MSWLSAEAQAHHCVDWWETKFANFSPTTATTITTN